MQPYNTGMADPARQQATYEDVRNAPENTIAELLHGTLRPASKHLRAASLPGSSLTEPFDRGRGGPGGWMILDEPELHLGPHVVVPDLAGWKRERMPRLPGTAWFELVPDWICEVLSPSTVSKDRGIKLPIYAEHRVAHAWLIDLGAATLEVLEMIDDRSSIVALFTANEKAPFDAIEIATADFLNLE